MGYPCLCRGELQLLGHGVRCCVLPEAADPLKKRPHAQVVQLRPRYAQTQRRLADKVEDAEGLCRLQGPARGDRSLVMLTTRVHRGLHTDAIGTRTIPCRSSGRSWPRVLRPAAGPAGGTDPSPCWQHPGTCAPPSTPPPTGPGGPGPRQGPTEGHARESDWCPRHGSAADASAAEAASHLVVQLEARVQKPGGRLDRADLERVQRGLVDPGYEDVPSWRVHAEACNGAEETQHGNRSPRQPTPLYVCVGGVGPRILRSPSISGARTETPSRS